MSAILLLLIGCSQISFKSSSKVGLKIGQRPTEGQVRRFVVEKRYNFYLFGFLPAKEEVLIDEMIGEAISKKLVLESIEDRRTNENVFWSIVSFGLYTPKTIKAVGYFVEN